MQVMEDQKDINTIKLQAIKQTHFMMGMNHEQNHSRGRSSTGRIDLETDSNCVYSQ